MISPVLPYNRGIPCTIALGINASKNDHMLTVPPFLLFYGTAVCKVMKNSQPMIKNRIIPVRISEE